MTVDPRRLYLYQLDESRQARSTPPAKKLHASSSAVQAVQTLARNPFDDRRLPNDRSATPPLRRNRPLGRLADSPRLPQMTSLMRGNDMEPRRQAEPHAADERIREAHTGKIDIRERA